MNKKEAGVEKCNKVQMIIEVAQKRFGLFGVEKTAMHEIANDLKLSKASLYYYFPDKESLYRAVVEKEQNEFIAKISNKILSIKEPEQLLREYAKSRLSYFRTLLNLSRLRLEVYSDLKPGFREAIQMFKEKEKEIIKRIFDNGIRSGIFFINDTDQTASLFLDLLKGLRISVVTDKKTLFIEQEEYDMLLDRTIAFTEIFINGVKTK
ncbi:MAG: TetR/AcrR family transcriptional regulator [Bacteroidales bacterium]|jgi:AcrR family transcriptional regulator